MKTKQLQIGKYIIINGLPVLFPLEIVHSDVITTGQSAGFFVIRITSYDVEVYCWGESTSLNLNSNQAHDAGIIKEFITTISGAFQKYATNSHATSQPQVHSTNCI
jgi:hypothetical protein